MKYIIYVLIDPRSGDWRYIGKSCKGLARAKEHAMPSILKLDTNKHKVNWIKQLHGLGLTYTVQVLEIFDKAEDLPVAEMEWIAAARLVGVPLINITNGGEGATGRKSNFKGRSLGFKHTEETKAALSKAKLGSLNPSYGKIYSEEQKQAKREFMIGPNRPIKSEACNKAAGVKVWLAKGGKCIKDLSSGIIYRTQDDVAKALGLHGTNIRKVACGERKSTGGRRFEYVTGTEKDLWIAANIKAVGE